MADHFYVYRQGGHGNPECFAQAHYLVGYAKDQSLTTYNEMAAKLRETFPDATDDEIHCHKVHTSDHVKNFTLVVYLPKRSDIRIDELNLTDQWTVREMSECKYWY